MLSTNITSQSQRMMSNFNPTTLTIALTFYLVSMIHDKGLSLLLASFVHCNHPL